MDVNSMAWVVVPIVLVFTYVIGTPILIYLTHKQAADPSILELDPKSELPPDIRPHFVTARESLSGLGFEYLGTYALPSQVSNVRAVLSVHLNRKEYCSAVSVLLFGQVEKTWKAMHDYTEFETKFRDGTAIDTNNSSQVVAYPAPDGLFRTQHPDLKRCEDLFTIHQAAVETRAQGRDRDLELFSRYNGNVSQYLASDLRQELSFAQECGYLSLRGTADSSTATANPYQTPSQPGVYQPTLKGAYLMTWCELFPFRQLRNAIVFRRHRRWRESLVHQGVGR